MDFSEQIKSPEALERELDPAPAQAAEEEHERDRDSDEDLRDGRARHEEEDGGLKDQRATALKGTKHRRATLGMGTQIGADGSELGAPEAHTENKVADAARVSIVATERHPLELAPGTVPREDQLFTRVTKGGHGVTHRRGSPASPNVTPTMAENNLFIDNAPNVADIRQGGLGDCYFLSCLLGVTQNDPGKIQSMMSISKHQVSVTFQRFDAKAGAYRPATIKTTSSLLTRKSRRGGISLVGAGMRVADAPKKSFWWAERHGKTIEVHRRDEYETALWAPMMEKAYADFAQSYGQYGHGKDAEERRLGSGYNIIDSGGAVEDCYQLFYGDAAVASTEDTHFTPGNDIVADNIPAIQRLLAYEAAKGNTAPGTTQQFMHARIGSNGAVRRGLALIERCKVLLFGEEVLAELSSRVGPAPTPTEQVQRLNRQINRVALQAALDNLRSVLADYLAGDADEDAVASATQAVIVPDLFPHLWDNSVDPSFSHLRDNLGILANLGSDSGSGQRTNYAGHAYQIRGIVLRDASGAPLALTAADLPARAGDIDPEKSLVEIHNPHATNEPDMRLTGPADGRDDGIFHYTLGQFLRNFDLLRMAEVSH